jgi:hypothetical protein
MLLFQGRSSPRVAAFAGTPAGVGRSLLAGIALAAPLAIINNLYFYMGSGTISFQNPLVSAWAALSPGIHEEIIFRFFVLALCLALLQSVTARRTALVVAVLLAVVPHSLNHLPDLLLENPVGGLILLIATSLLFGLPMALLQLRRDLESRDRLSLVHRLRSVPLRLLIATAGEEAKSPVYGSLSCRSYSLSSIPWPAHPSRISSALLRRCGDAAAMIRACSPRSRGSSERRNEALARWGSCSHSSADLSCGADCLNHPMRYCSLLASCSARDRRPTPPSRTP